MKGRAIKNKSNKKEISKLLDSDDELPDSYDETPDIPAYQNERRFEQLERVDFQWLYQLLENASTQTEQKEDSLEEPSKTNKIFPTQRSSLYDDPCSNEILHKGTREVKKNKKRVLISKGVLSKRDIFFIKSIEEYSTDTTLLWFIDFLINKAVQPLQRGCLAADITANHYTAAKEVLSDFNMRYYLKLVIN